MILEGPLAIEAACEQGQGFLREAMTGTAAKDLDACTLIKPQAAVHVVQLDIDRTLPVLFQIADGAVTVPAPAVCAGHIDAPVVAEEIVRVCHNRDKGQVDLFINKIGMGHHLTGSQPACHPNGTHGHCSIKDNWALIQVTAFTGHGAVQGVEDVDVIGIPETEHLVSLVKPSGHREERTLCHVDDAAGFIGVPRCWPVKKGPLIFTGLHTSV